MRRLLIIGYGEVAERTAPLLASTHRLYALTRSREKVARIESVGITPITGDLDAPHTLRRLAGLAHDIIHFVPPQNEGDRDRRTAHLLAALGSRQSLPYRVVYISTSGVYGDCAGAEVAETRRLNPQTARARRRLDAERQLRAWGIRNKVCVSILRVPGIYGPGRLPLARIRAQTPALYADDDVYTNHIHIDDLARICAAALRRGRPNRVYNCGDDSQLKMGEYFDLVADAFALPRPPRVSRAQALSQLPQLLLSFMSESRRLVSERAKKELRVRLAYPEVEKGVAQARIDALTFAPVLAIDHAPVRGADRCNRFIGQQD